MLTRLYRFLKVFASNFIELEKIVKVYFAIIKAFNQKRINMLRKFGFCFFSISLVCLFLFTEFSSAQVLEQIRSKGYKIEYQGEGGALFSSEKDTSIRILALDLRKIKISQIVSNPINKTNGNGFYSKNSSSPYFKRYNYSDIIKQANPNTFAIINAMFFEQYADSTQLSFPIKVNGKILTGGSSPYGPNQNPKHDYYKNAKLLALVFNTNSAKIITYGTSEKNVFQNDDIQNGLVSYNYKEHPAVIFQNNKVTRFLLVGTLHDKSQKNENQYEDEWLIVAIAQKTIGEVADILKNVGVKSEIMTLDGGTSVFLYGTKFGLKEAPGFDSNSKDSIKARNLPHYLQFDLK